MANRPESPAPKKAPRKKAKAAPKAAPEDTSPSGATSLKLGVSDFLRRAEGYVAKRAPGLVEKAERVAHSAIDGTARGINQFERDANELEGRAREGLRRFLDKGRKP